MAEYNVLESVKRGLGLEGNDYHDGTLQEHIDEAMQYLIDGGVPESIVISPKCKGVIFRGVSDLWNYGAGNATLSTYFKERAAQLALKYGGAANGQA